MKNNLPLLSIMLINRFEGICGTFGEGKKTIVINNIGLVCPEKRKEKKNLLLLFLKQ
jgi:hypothetical protein